MMVQLKQPGVDSYIGIIVDHLNTVLGTSERSTYYWTHELPKLLLEKFKVGCKMEDWRSPGEFEENLINAKMWLFKRLKQLEGLQFSKVTEELLQEDSNILDSPK